MIRPFACCLPFLLLLAGDLKAADAERTISLELRGSKIEGMPLTADAQLITLLGREGRLWKIKPAEVTKFSSPQPGFRSYSIAEMRNLLVKEFGTRYEMTGTGHFLVIHPAGQRDRWAERFEQVYRSFVHYYTARGFAIEPPKFLLVAVVFPTQEDFQRYARTDGLFASAQVLGYYAQESNRISLYDVTAGRAANVPWQTNADTILHEVAHQVAFNTGVHRRFAQTPKWVVEGLGTMFEAPGVWDAARHPQPQDRLNIGRLRDFQQYAAKRRRKGSLAEFVQSDRIFDINPSDAYAEAWALSFYLCETQPRKYAAYMKKMAELDPFRRYESPQRLQDFLATFGPNLSLLETQFVKYMSELK